MLTPASWARGRYESYLLHPDGTLVGTVHPSGLAFECVCNGEEIPTDHILFLSSHNQKCWGKWFICANLLQPCRTIATGSRFPCQLILLLGATSNTSTLLQPKIILHYYSLRKDLSSTAVLQAFKSSSFVSNIFDMNLKSACYSNMHIRYLNQIFGPTISSWNATKPSLAPVSGKQFYQCREGPDRWPLKSSSHKLTLKDICLTKPNISEWPNPYEQGKETERDCLFFHWLLLENFSTHCSVQSHVVSLFRYFVSNHNEDEYGRFQCQ